MKRHLLACCAGVALIAASIPSPASAQSAVRGFRAEDHYRLQSAGDVRLSPDGSRAAFVQRFIDAERRNRSHVWVATLADGKALAFLSGRRGPSETGFLPTAFGNSIAVWRLDTGATDVVAEYRVTNHPLAYQGSAEQIAWAPDGSALAYLSADTSATPTACTTTTSSPCASPTDRSAA